MPRFIVLTSRSKMPSSCPFGDRYCYSAIVELDELGQQMFQNGQEPKMISKRAKGVARVVEYGKDLFWGKTEASAARRDRARLEAKAAQMNAEEEARAAQKTPDQKFRETARAFEEKTKSPALKAFFAKVARVSRELSEMEAAQD